MAVAKKVTKKRVANKRRGETDARIFTPLSTTLSLRLPILRVTLSVGRAQANFNSEEAKSLLRLPLKSLAKTRVRLRTTQA